MAKEKLTEQQYEEFDYITDFYMPIKEVEDKYNSPHLKRLRDAKIDSYEYLGLEKVEGVGEIKKIQWLVVARAVTTLTALAIKYFVL